MSGPLPILLYHAIDEKGLSTSTAPAVFRQHLATMSRNGWRSLTATQFTHHLATGRPFPERSFLITFDDGYLSVRTAALGILREFGFHAISFLSTQFMRGPKEGEAASHPGDEPDRFMSWDQARELQASGLVDCQSHSHTHSNFSAWSTQDILRDLGTSVDLLARELRLPRGHFRHLAWPWGLSAPAWREAAGKAGFSVQYGVSRQAFRLAMGREDIPRTCFDGAATAQFERQLWLQTGSFSPLWDLAYPIGRRLRQFTRVLRLAIL